MSDRDVTQRERLTGGCQCGAVRYAFHGVPRQVGICHCRMCQKASGGPFAVYAVVALGDFEWTRGAPATWASSSNATRDFCPACGTPLAYRENVGGEIELLTGTLDQPERAVPTGEVGIEAKLAWLNDLPGLPGKTTEQNRGPHATAVVSRQHPDQDTDEAWSAPP